MDAWDNAGWADDPASRPSLGDPWAREYPVQPDDLLREDWEKVRRSDQRQYRRFVEANWETFPSNSGTHIRRERTAGRRRYNLVAHDHGVLATLQEGHAWPSMIMLRSVQVGGRSYHVPLQGVRTGHDAELIDISDGSAVLRVMGRHYGGKSNAVVTFSDHRRFHFPILGSGLSDEVMTAVDEEGNRVVRYRQTKRRTTRTGSAAWVEAVVNPACKVTPDVLLLIAISSGFLLTEYRARPGGGGGGGG